MLTIVFPPAAVACSVVSVLYGQIPMLLWRRRRHIFWLLPLVNTLVVLGLSWSVITARNTSTPSSSSQCWGVTAMYLGGWIGAVGAAVAGGVIGAALITPVFTGLKWLFRTGASAPVGDEATWAKLRASSSPLTGFIEGLSAPWAGFRYMRRHRELLPYAITPFVLNVLLTTVLLVVLLAGAVALIDQFRGMWQGGWVRKMIVLLVHILIVVAALGGTAIGWVLLQGILCDHFYAKLAAQVERQLGLDESEIVDVPFRYQVADSFYDTGWLLLVNTGCVLVQIVPGLGTVLGVCAGGYFNCMTFGGDYLGHPLALRGWRRGEQRGFARQHRPHTLGLGAAVLVIALIPVLGAALLSSAAVGAVLLHRRLEVAAATASPKGGTTANRRLRAFAN